MHNGGTSSGATRLAIASVGALTSLNIPPSVVMRLALSVGSRGSAGRSDGFYEGAKGRSGKGGDRSLSMEVRIDEVEGRYWHVRHREQHESLRDCRTTTVRGQFVEKSMLF